jgi:FkbM family methyltransferase
MTALNQVRQTFAMEKLPANIRASQRWARRPFFRRFTRLPIGLKWFSAAGRFSYRRQGKSAPVVFNGRNLQFHALYDAAFQHGYELETACLLATLCRGGAAFYDVGSNWGYFSLLAAALPEFTGPIFAFEPNPGTFADLTDIIAQAGVADRVRACHLGVGREECEMVVAETDAFNTGFSRLTRQGGGRRVAVKPVDRLGFAAPGVIKIDAEGMELDVLAGAVQTLAAARPFVILENMLDVDFPGRTYAAMDFLQANAYRVFIPVLVFKIDGCAVCVSYGQDYPALVAHDPDPQVGAVEISGARRFLLNGQLNLLGVHQERVGDLWRAGVADMGKM